MDGHGVFRRTDGAQISLPNKILKNTHAKIIISLKTLWKKEYVKWCM